MKKVNKKVGVFISGILVIIVTIGFLVWKSQSTRSGLATMTYMPMAYGLVESQLARSKEDLNEDLNIDLEVISRRAGHTSPMLWSDEWGVPYKIGRFNDGRIAVYSSGPNRKFEFGANDDIAYDGKEFLCSSYVKYHRVDQGGSK